VTADARSLRPQSAGPVPELRQLRRSPLGHRAAELSHASGDRVRLAELPFLSIVNVRVAPGSPAAARVAAALGVRLPGPGRVGTSPRSGPAGAAARSEAPRTAATGSEPVAAASGSEPVAVWSGQEQAALWSGPERAVAWSGPERAVAWSGPERAALWSGPDEWLVVGPDGDAAEIVAQASAALNGAPGSVVDVSADRTTIALAGSAAREVLEKGMTIDLHPRAFGPDRAAATTIARTRVVLWQVGEEPAYRLLVRGSFASYLADWLIDATAEFRH
jgi:sarcosine oxidase, subunit gamma